mmetsp:Transcript_14920/g.45609  ORF Transcript_14920/g.45609 Transcript_14920/m.45609 type:complete len:295 (-) Transcript_14920:875-1759(-)
MLPKLSLSRPGSSCFRSLGGSRGGRRMIRVKDGQPRERMAHDGLVIPRAAEGCHLQVGVELVCDSFDDTHRQGHSHKVGFEVHVVAPGEPEDGLHVVSDVVKETHVWSARMLHHRVDAVAKRRCILTRVWDARVLNDELASEPPIVVNHGAKDAHYRAEGAWRDALDDAGIQEGEGGRRRLIAARVCDCEYVARVQICVHKVVHKDHLEDGLEPSAGQELAFGGLCEVEYGLALDEVLHERLSRNPRPHRPREAHSLYICEVASEFVQVGRLLAQVQLRAHGHGELFGDAHGVQ